MTIITPPAKCKRVIETNMRLEVDLEYQLVETLSCPSDQVKEGNAGPVEAHKYGKYHGPVLPFRCTRWVAAVLVLRLPCLTSRGSCCGRRMRAGLVDATSNGHCARSVLVLCTSRYDPFCALQHQGQGV